MGSARVDAAAAVLADGRVLVAGGSNGSGPVNTAEIYDPSTGNFNATGPMISARRYATATLLPNGTVLVAGGYDGTSPLSSAEIFDPNSGTFSATAGAMAHARYFHVATLLQNGTVLITGGFDGTPSLTAAEIYDPSTGTFSSTGTMSTSRQVATATLLTDGRVLVAGGYDGANYLSSTEIYDPAAHTFSAGPAMGNARSNHTASLLQDGRVLLAGGYDGTNRLSTADIYTPAAGAAGTITSAASTMASPRVYFSADTLGDGRVLLMGGTDGTGPVASADVFDPSTNKFSAAGPLVTARGYHMSALLHNGDVIVMGGITANGATASAELYTPFVAAGNMYEQRSYFAYGLLLNGKVLVGGGSGNGGYGISADLFDPTTATFAQTGSFSSIRWQSTATLLDNGKLLVAGGASASNTAEIYDPSTGLFSSASLVVARYGHAAATLPDGRVLIAGGLGTYASIATTEIFDPATQTSTPAAQMSVPRGYAVMTTLADGRVLVAGGDIDLSGTSTATAEIYDPSTNSFAPTGSMAVARSAATATLLNDGRVLITGGRTTGYAPVDTAEIYDPVQQTFSTVGSHLSAARYSHTATLLNNGTVLITGGIGTSYSYVSDADIFDPVTNRFFVDGNMTAARANQASVLLQDGRVLIAGGTNNFGNLVTSELYTPSSKTPPNLMSIAVSAVNGNIGIGVGQQFIATGTFSDNHTEKLQSVTWTSSDTTIATVTNDASNHGRVYGINSGSVAITACAGAICGSTTASSVNPSDVSISVGVTPGAIAPGTTQNLTYGILVTNHGSAAATNVQMTDSLPAGVTFVSANATGGGTCSGTSTVTCNWSSFTATEQESVTIVGAANAPASDLVNTASVSTTSFDPNPANNTGTVTTYVSACMTSPPAGYDTIWIGGKSSDWNTPENWSTQMVPNGANDVFICAQAPHAAIAGGSDITRNLLVGSGTSINVASTLTATGNVDATAGPIQGSGTFIMAGSGSFTMAGTFPSTIVSSTVSLAGPTTFVGLTLNGSLDISGQSASVAGDLTTNSGSSLIMQNAAGNLTVSGNANFIGGNNSGTMTAGTLNLAGNFNVSCCDQQAFAASGSHVTNLIGSGFQTIGMYHGAFDTTGDHFQYLNIAKTGGAVYIDGDLAVAGDLITSSPTFVGSNSYNYGYLYVQGNVSMAPGSALSPYQLLLYGSILPTGGSVGAYEMYFEGANDQIQGTVGAQYAVIYGTVTLAGDTTFSQNLDIYGKLDLNGHAAQIGGYLNQAGAVLMTHATDKMTVQGDANFNGYGSDTTTCGTNPIPCPTAILTAGTLELAGGLYVENDGAFVASGSHLTRLIGKKQQNISFYSTQTTNRLQDLEIANTSPVGQGLYLSHVVTISGKLIKKPGASVYVYGNDYGFDTAGVDVNGLVLDDATMTIGAGPIVAFDNVTFQDEAYVGDQLTINHPGAATPFTFSSLRFFSVPGPNFHYVVANDTLSDSNTLTINLANAFATQGPAYTITSGQGAVTASASAVLSAGAVAGFSINNGGSGYTTAPTVTLVGGDGTGASAVAVLTGNAVSAINVVSAGSGYTVAPIVVISPPAGTAVVNWLPSSLAHWYTFQGNANDQIGSANGTLVGGATAAYGVLTLDGTTGYVQFATPLIPNSGSYSVTMFATEATASSTIAELISQGQTGGGFYIGHDAAGQIRLGDGWISTGIPFPSDGQRHHYALSVDGSANLAQFYIDGVLAGTHAAIYPNAGDNTKLGAQFLNFGEYFQGRLDDVRIYNSALTPGAVATLVTGEDQGTNLAIVNEAGSPSPTAIAQDQTTYLNFIISNYGPTYAPGVKAHITVPADATVSTGMNCTGAAPTLTCDVGDIDVGSSTYESIGVTLNTLGANVISVNVSSGIVDPDSADNTFSSTVQVTNSGTDLSLSLTGAASAAPNSTASFVATVSNATVADEAGAVITMALPPGMTFVTTGSDASCSGTTTVTCVIGTVTALSSVSATINVMTGAAGPYYLTASVASTNSDINTYNNSASIQLLVSQYGLGVIERESVDNNAQPVLYGYAEDPSASSDGRFVAFDAYGAYLAQDTNSNYDVYLRDNCRNTASGTCRPTTTLISADANGNGGNGESYWPSVNRTGRYVAFDSYATNLTSNNCTGDCYFGWQVYVRDTQLNTTTLVSQGLDGNIGSYDSGYYGPPAISATGRYIAFDSEAENLTPQGAADEYSQIVLRDTCIGAPAGCVPTSTLVTQNVSGAATAAQSYHPSISADGRYVAFESYASDLVFGGTDGYSHIFLRDTCIGAQGNCTPNTIVVDAGINGAEANGYSYSPSVSATGRYVVFDSDATNLVARTTGESSYEQVYLRDTCIGAVAGCAPRTILLSRASDGTAGNGYSYLSYAYDYTGDGASPATISDTGRYVTFITEASNLIPGFAPTNSVQVVRDTCLGATTACTPSTVVVETTNDGNTPNSSIYYFGSISGDGSVVTFDTEASNILTNPAGYYYSSDVFLASTGFAPSGLGTDLSVSISAPIASIVLGSNFGYGITVTNIGGNGATSVNLTDILPGAVSFVSVTPSQGTCSGTTTITCALGSLGSGASAVVNVTVTATSVGTVANSVSVSAAESELNTANNSASVSVTIAPPVSVTVSPLSATVHIGATQQFAATVTGTANTAVTWSASAGSIDANGLFTAPSTPGAVTVTATSVADTTVSGSVTVNVVGNADLVVTNSFSVAGGSPVYTATVSDSGPAPASSVSLRITFNRFTFVTYSNPSGSCSFSAPVLTCNLGSLAVSANKSVSVVVGAPSGGWASLTSAATALEYDPNPANNSAQISPTDQIYNTSAGANISVLAADGSEAATVDFASVSAPGSTSLTTLPLTTPPPAGYRSGGAAVYYDIATTASYTGMIQLNFQFPAGAFHHPSKVRLFHMENGVWVDRTTSVNPALGAVSGATTSLSPFALFEPVDAVPVANGGADTLVSGALSSGATVTLDGSASTDADGDALTYRWSGPFAEGAIVTGLRPTVTLPFGTSKVTLVVNDGEQNSAPVTLNVTVSDFAVAAGTPGATVAAGTAATYAISLAPKFGAFNAPVTLSCANLPTGVSCSFSPATLTPGASGATSTLTLNTSSSLLASSTRPARRPAGWGVIALMLAPFGFISIGASATKRKRWLVALMMVALIALAACGGGSMTSTSTSTGTSHQSVTKTVVVTATSAGVAHSTSVTVTVQ